jgi:hypothetical protein
LTFVSPDATLLPFAAAKELGGIADGIVLVKR